MPKVDIIFQDEDIVVINKPTGYPVHPSDRCRGALSAMEILRDQLGQYVYPAHRIDRPTSGIVIFTLKKELLKPIQADFAERKINKGYIAVTRGWAPESTIVEEELQKKNGDFQDGRTRFRRLEHTTINEPVGPYETARYSLLYAKPYTGRYRQIRRHLRDISYPIVGDTSEGDIDHNRFMREKFNIHRLLLHAWQIDFTHPITQQKWLIRAAVPPEFQQALKDIFSPEDENRYQILNFDKAITLKT